MHSSLRMSMITQYWCADDHGRGSSPRNPASVGCQSGGERYDEHDALRKQTPNWCSALSMLGFRQFSMRGLEKACGEWSLVIMAWNRKRVFALNPA
jgi:hypothetical protein